MKNYKERFIVQSLSGVQNVLDQKCFDTYEECVEYINHVLKYENIAYRINKEFFKNVDNEKK